ncbi:molybdenum cofactor biosynthesis protein MoaE [Telmatospirillum sp.]|uniref:molybdenum cofactor biosynthesis protein MoaE n=1 Tax=Telmatospirillum sp. TaxID=2079197 RepID=UPI00283D6CC6|nr:molybdenum cofactor biosynthesis protein MoaE [Telmatospirillum sp.]MDR3438467.1 molybdenum cofactor biosynthesis protein MoaE [Telmatospirillum sp.]
MTVRVQRDDFDPGAEVDRLTKGKTSIGAVTSFVGFVRGDASAGEAMTLEHYPGMTERQLLAIEAEARTRWPIDDVMVIHRFGRLLPGDRIVLVAVASSHRAAAFSACEFLIDWLKTRAPFWKLEDGADGPHWVDAKDDDDERADRWTTGSR